MTRGHGARLIACRASFLVRVDVGQLTVVVAVTVAVPVLVFVVSVSVYRPVGANFGTVNVKLNARVLLGPTSIGYENENCRPAGPTSVCVTVTSCHWSKVFVMLSATVIGAPRTALSVRETVTVRSPPVAVPVVPSAGKRQRPAPS